MNRESLRFMCQHGTDTRTGECPRCASDRSDRMMVISACIRYVDVGREIPETLRVRLSERDLKLVAEYKDSVMENLDCRR